VQAYDSVTGEVQISELLNQNRNSSQNGMQYTNKMKKYEQEANTVGDAVNQTRQAEMQDLVKRITDYRDNAQKELQKKESDLVKPLMDKIKASIQKVGKAKGYQYVLNVADLLLADGPDLTADIKKDLGF
jgi:outer membrane protein